MGRRNRSGVSYDKESYAYYKRAYAANKSYADRVGNNYGRILTKREWEQAHRNHSNEDIVYRAFHQWDKHTTEFLYNVIKKLKIDNVTKSDVKQGALSQEMWDQIDDSYWEWKSKGCTPKEATERNAHMYFGSP